MSKQKKTVKEFTERCVFEGPSSDTLIVRFKDEFLCPSGSIITVPGKGAISNKLSEILLSRLNDLGIDTYFLKALNMREQVVQSVTPLPFFIQTHFVAGFEFSDRFGIEEGTALTDRIVEFVHESETLGNRTLSERHIVGLGWLDYEALEDLCRTTQRINDFLMGFFSAFEFQIAQSSLRFGCFYDGFLEPIFTLTQDLTFDALSVIDLKTNKLYDFETLDNEDEVAEFYKIIIQRLPFFAKS